VGVQLGVLQRLLHDRHWPPQQIGDHLAALLTATFLRDRSASGE